jgi:hypothetical protein
LDEIEITPSGFGIHFPKLDADLYVPGLLRRSSRVPENGWHQGLVKLAANPRAWQSAQRPERMGNLAAGRKKLPGAKSSLRV